MKVKNFIASIALGAFLLIPSVSALSGDLVLTSDKVKFNTETFLQYKPVRIWATVANHSPNDLLGSVRFLVNGENLSSDQPISAIAGNSDDVFVDWTPNAPGTYELIISVIPWDDSQDNPGNNTVYKTIQVLADMDRDGITDSSDSDRDGDGVSNTEDTFPDNPNEWLDTDGDGIGNNADPDDDNDGVLDAEDAFPQDVNYSSDINGDGIPDEEDEDMDGDGLTNLEEAELGTDPKNPDTDADGVNDKDDAFPLDPNEWSDLDGNGIGDNNDPDRDGDGVPNEEDLNPDKAKPEAKLKNGSKFGWLNQILGFEAYSETNSEEETLKYLWDFGEVQLAGESVELLFETSGVKTGVLTIEDEYGQSDSLEVKIRVLSKAFVLSFLLLALLLICLAFYLIYRYNRRASVETPVKTSAKTKSKSTKSNKK